MTLVYYDVCTDFYVTLKQVKAIQSICTVEHQTQAATHHTVWACSLSCTSPSEEENFRSEWKCSACAWSDAAHFDDTCAVEISCVFVWPHLSVLRERGRWPTFFSH